MIRLDDKVIDLVEKICRALKDGRIGADAFPMDEILNLIECTLGESFGSASEAVRAMASEICPTYIRSVLQGHWKEKTWMRASAYYVCLNALTRHFIRR